MSDRARCYAVFSLVEKRPGLLSGKWRHQETDALLNYFKLRRRLAVKRARNHFQTFVLANAYVVALNNRARLKLFRQ